MKSCTGTFLGNSYFVFLFLSCPEKKGKYKYKLFKIYYLRGKKKIGSGSGRLYRSFFPSDVSDKRQNSGPVFWNVWLIPRPEIDPQNRQIFPPKSHPHHILPTNHKGSFRHLGCVVSVSSQVPSLSLSELAVKLCWRIVVLAIFGQ